LNPSLKNEVFAVRGERDHIRSDNGPEFANKAVKRWLAISGVKTLFIASGSPWENGYLESFNSTLRDELLDRELFLRKDVKGGPLEFKYVDGSSKGRKVRRLEDPEYKRQIIKRII
jgi:transposase InsO family protein